MTAIRFDGSVRHHGGAARTIGEIYQGRPLRSGWRDRREFEAEHQMREAPPSPSFTLDPVKALQATRWQRAGAIAWAAGEFEDAEEFYSIARYIMGIEDSVTIDSV
jgi:hypothetical protein